MQSATAASGSLSLWRVDAPHPEATVSAIFGPVWYEGDDKPANVWQSSSGTDDFEPKYGLLPLIFGTIKATLYAMLFGGPLALLAAVYTSEIMHSRWRGLGSVDIHFSQRQVPAKSTKAMYDTASLS